MPQRVIEFGSERQFAKEVAEGVLVEHNYLPRRHREAEIL
jgi:hypothetical protein